MDKKGLKHQNYYAFNALSTSQVELNTEYSYLVSRIMQIHQELDLGIQPVEDIAKLVLECINSCIAFPAVDRVCLSIIHPSSSRIAVLSSHNSGLLSTNKMDPSYSCYVSATSSIFATKSSNLRIYADIEEIINLYDDRPIQRSLGLLRKMGVKSGVTIPLTLSPLISGFLFLNSARTSTFNHLSKEDYLLLSLLKLVAKTSLQSYCFGEFGVESEIGRYLKKHKQATNTFSIEAFQTALKEVLEIKFPEIKSVKLSSSIQKPFLYAYGPVIVSIIKAISLFDKKLSEISLNFEIIKIDGVDYVKLSVPDVVMTQNKIQSFNELKILTNQQIVLHSPYLQLISVLDLASLADYSI